MKTMTRFLKAPALKALVVAFGLAFGGVAPAAASEGHIEIPSVDWSFNGIFGTFDQKAQRRGLQVYKEVCAACHGLKYIYFRNLADIGFTEDQIKAFAAEYTMKDGPNDDGEMFDRPGRPSDRFPSPFPNEQAARAANNGAFPPDLSLIVDARANGANYVHAMLLGFEDPPAGIEMQPGMNYNKYFPGHQMGMPKILNDDGVTYADGTKATEAQMASDVVQFLAWATEPNLEERKRMGVRVMLFLIVLTGLMFAIKKKVWKDVAH